MGLFNIFKKKSKPCNNSMNNVFISDLKFNDINIEIGFNIEESKNHLLDDYKVLEKNNLEQLIKNQFIPMLKENDFIDRDNDKIYNGINIYAIDYKYGKIIDKYSPTGEENYFGQFEFCFESSNEYTSDMLESVCMEVYILNGKIVKVSSYTV